MSGYNHPVLNVTAASITVNFTQSAHDGNVSVAFTQLNSSTVGAEKGGGFSVEELVILITTPIVFSFGLFGNFLSALVMTRGHFKTLSTGVYLFCLTIADTTFLSVNSMTKNFIVICGHLDLTKVSDWSCKVYVYLLMTSKCMSAWLIVAVTVERLIVVCIPLKAKVVATRRKAWMTLAVCSTVVGAIYALILVTFRLRPRPWGWDCTMHEYYTGMGLRVFLNTFDLVVYSLVPATILFLSNIVLIVKIVQSRNLRMHTASQASANQNDDVAKVTLMLVLISVMFLLCTLPISLLFLIKSIDSAITDIPNYSVLYRGVYTLQLSNSAINFFLYCMSGPKFRQELWALVPCVKTEK